MDDDNPPPQWAPFPVFPGKNPAPSDEPGLSGVMSASTKLQVGKLEGKLMEMSCSDCFFGVVGFFAVVSTRCCGVLFCSMVGVLSGVVYSWI